LYVRFFQISKHSIRPSLMCYFVLGQSPKLTFVTCWGSVIYRQNALPVSQLSTLPDHWKPVKPIFIATQCFCFFDTHDAASNAKEYAADAADATAITKR